MDSGGRTRCRTRGRRRRRVRVRASGRRSGSRSAGWGGPRLRAARGQRERSTDQADRLSAVTISSGCEGAATAAPSLGLLRAWGGDRWFLHGPFALVLNALSVPVEREICQERADPDEVVGKRAVSCERAR